VGIQMENPRKLIDEPPQEGGFRLTREFSYQQGGRENPDGNT